MNNMNYTKVNKDKWNEWSGEGCTWTLPIGHEEFLKAEKGNFEIFLTPLKPVPIDWLGNLKGAKVLGLASGGGQQCPVFVANGADVTVFDLSESQLEAERKVAERENYKINIVKGDMTKPFPFNDNTYDLIFHPVSNCFIEDVNHVWRECYRVLKPNGILLSGFINPIVYMMEGNEQELKITNKIPYNSFTDCTFEKFDQVKKQNGVQFGHTLEDQIRGQLKAGFYLSDMYEDKHPTDLDSINFTPTPAKVASYLSKYINVYMSTKVIKR